LKNTILEKRRVNTPKNGVCFLMDAIKMLTPTETIIIDAFKRAHLGILETWWLKEAMGLGPDAAFNHMRNLRRKGFKITGHRGGDKVGGWRMGHKIPFNGGELDLSRREMIALEGIRNAGDRGLSMEELIVRLSVDTLEHPDRAVAGFIRTLRRKLEKHGYTLAKAFRDLNDTYKLVPLSAVNSRRELVG